jgi:hypothetical protein
MSGAKVHSYCPWDTPRQVGEAVEEEKFHLDPFVEAVRDGAERRKSWH